MCSVLLEYVTQVSPTFIFVFLIAPEENCINLKRMAETDVL
ncbi:hypothetical protein [Methanosarcina acetivorans]